MFSTYFDSGAPFVNHPFDKYYEHHGNAVRYALAHLNKLHSSFSGQVVIHNTDDADDVTYVIKQTGEAPYVEEKEVVQA